MKYIIFKSFADRPIPIIFPNRIEHEEMREQMPYADVLSGGYVDLRDGAFFCHGAAPDLDLSPGDNDSEIIMEHFSVNNE